LACAGELDVARLGDFEDLEGIARARGLRGAIYSPERGGLGVRTKLGGGGGIGADLARG
jgi:hypothetical protein